MEKIMDFFGKTGFLKVIPEQEREYFIFG